jgi:hypothetical protein
LSSVKVFSDGVKQCRKFFFGQRLASMVSVKSSENVVDLSPFAFGQFDAVRGIGDNSGTTKTQGIFALFAGLAFRAGILCTWIRVARCVRLRVQRAVHFEKGNVRYFAFAQQTSLWVISKFGQLLLTCLWFQPRESSVRSTEIEISVFVNIALHKN